MKTSETKPDTPPAGKSCDALHQGPGEESVPTAWRRHHARLLQLRKQLLEEMEELERNAQEEAPSFSMHMADAGTDSFDRDLALSLLGMEQDAVGEIDAALQRIRNGRYGVCELTGQLIPRKRLEAIPWARYTVEAQDEMERIGAAVRPYLNKLESRKSG